MLLKPLLQTTEDESDDYSQESECSDNSSRAIAYQLDFLTAVLIIVGAVSLFFLFGVGLLEDISAVEAETDYSVGRSVDMLADEYLVAEPKDTTLDRKCTEAFFTRNPDASCNQNPSWGSDDYLKDALPLKYGNVNATLWTSKGDIVTLSANDMTEGEPVPSRSAGVHEWTRYVLIDSNGDGKATIHRLTVYYWG